jgi:hypothetical protein
MTSPYSGDSRMKKRTPGTRRRCGLAALFPFLLPSLTTLLVVLILSFRETVFAEDSGSYISFKKGRGSFALSSAGKTTPMWVSSQDYPGVIRVLKQLQTDIDNVTGAKPTLSIDTIPRSKEIVLVGTLGRSPLIDNLVKEKKLDIQGIAGNWETFLIQVIEKPLPGVDLTMVLVGRCAGEAS